MKKTLIHVAQQAIAKNRKHGTNDPAIIVRQGGKSQRTNAVEIVHEGVVVGRFVYSPHKPLSCGARLWFEVPDGVTVSLDDPQNDETCEVNND